MNDMLERATITNFIGKIKEYVKDPMNESIVELRLRTPYSEPLCT